MDDPWGSPWSTTDNDKDSKPANLAKSDLAPPPRALLSASGSPRIPAILEQSPWGDDDDDGFGDWAAPEASPAQPAWAGGWTTLNSNLTPRRDDSFDKASPIAWPGTVATPKPANGPALRQPSPDPWASDHSLRAPSHDGVSTPQLVVDAASPVGPSAETVEETGLSVSAAWDDGVSEARAETEGNARDEAVASFVEEPSSTDTLPFETATATLPAETEIPNNLEAEHDGNQLRLSVESIAHSRGSHSSAQSNEDTDHEDHHHGSPITSIDEEPRSRQQVSRKPSGKVQELVEKFDGLARASSRDRSSSRHGRSISRHGRSTSRHGRSKSTLDSRRRPVDPPELDGFDDIGEFETPQEDQEDGDDATAGAPPATSSAIPRPATPDEAHRQQSVTTPSVSSPRPSTLSSPRSLFDTASVIPADFAIDLGSLDKLFSKAVQEPAQSEREGDWSVSDHIVNDSFTEISQRKTWYRISRLGSSRRHNAGDDDNYRRVEWPTSDVHQRTIQIVRRWMEEDSIAGRVALGGGIAKTQKNMFGWDSSAEPIALDTVFRKKTHSRTPSLQPIQTTNPPPQGPGGAIRKFSGSLRSPPGRPQSVPGPPVATFSWSSDSPVVQSQPPPPEALPTIAGPSIVPPPKALEPKPEIPVASAPAQPKQPALPSGPAESAPAAKALEETEDDDWGEMVSSPSDAKPAAIDGFPQLDGVMAPALSTSGAAVAHVADFSCGPAHLMNTKQAGQSTSNTGDIWQSVDLSVFEGPSRPAPSGLGITTASLAPPPAVSSDFLPPPTPASVLSSHYVPETPIALARPLTLMTASTSSMGATDDSFIPPTPLAITEPITMPATPGQEDDYFASRTDDDETVRFIISNLPDLSYMLR